LGCRVPQYLTVSDVEDPRIAAFRDGRERDLVGRQGRFIAEGEVVLRTAIRSGRFPVQQVLLAEKRLPGLKEALDRLPRAAEVYCAPQAVMDRVVGFEIHRGVLALGTAFQQDARTLLDALSPRALVLALLGLGIVVYLCGVFRFAAAFGADVVLVGEDCCDPLYRKAIRVSVGAVLTTPWARVGFGGVDALVERGFEVLALTPQDGEPLNGIRPAARTALLLGSEGPGLPPALMARRRKVSIPMAGDFDSLNVATTSAVALWALTVDRHSAA
jgi:tRNA G18 (ribose-2'-O)-methylase SpoU